VLHWAPRVYGQVDTSIRLGAAWLLWGYGVAFAITVLMWNSKTIPAPQQQ